MGGRKTEFKPAVIYSKLTLCHKLLMLEGLVNISVYVNKENFSNISTRVVLNSF